MLSVQSKVVPKMNFLSQIFVLFGALCKGAHTSALTEHTAPHLHNTYNSKTAITDHNDCVTFTRKLSPQKCIHHLQ